MDFIGSFSFLTGLYASMLVLIGPDAFLWILMGPFESFLVLNRPYGL